MFRAFSFPSSGATTTAVATSGLPSELVDSSAVGRGRARPRPTAPHGRVGVSEKIFSSDHDWAPKCAGWGFRWFTSGSSHEYRKAKP
jgi:hypothetical protein